MDDRESKHGDRAILAELGSRIAAERVARNMTQGELAKEAGIAKRTVERIEAGQSAQLTSFIRLLRALDLAQRLYMVLPEAQPGPMDLLKHGGKWPQRASSRKARTDEPWRWGDDE